MAYGRWNPRTAARLHPVGGVARLINQITGLVLDKAFAQLVEWDREGGTAAGLRMSVNVTPMLLETVTSLSGSRHSWMPMVWIRHGSPWR